MNKKGETGMSGSELIKYEEIQNKIYTIRGVQVMLDEDLALLYGVETKVLNQAVKRNSERFPEDFMFQLSEEEYKLLRSQNVTLEKWDSLRSQNATIEDKRGQHRKYLPYVFTPKQWIEKTNAIGYVSKAKRYGGTCGIAKCETFKAASAQQVVSQLTQISREYNIVIIPKCRNMKEVIMV